MNHSPLETPVFFHIGVIPFSRPVVTTWGLMVLLAGASLIMKRSLRIDAGGWQVVVETIVVGIEEEVAALLNRDAAPFLPLLGTLFIFLVIANLSGIVPGISSPTASLETPGALATIVFLSVHFYGVRMQGLGAYLKGYLKPNPIMLPFNILSELTRSFSLAMRLFGNIMSGELIVAIVVGLAGLLVPIPFMAFGILVGLVQAYIFSVLAAVYIGGVSVRSRNEGGGKKMTVQMLSIIGAAVAVAVGSIAPALAEGRAIAAAMEGIARQPEAAGALSRTLFVGLAMIETMAIYCLVVALLLLFANPFAR
jgi:F-type H+-transporting ATPase subunit a